MVREIKSLTRRSIIRNAPKRWLGQYAQHDDNHVVTWGAHPRKTYGQIRHALASLNTDTCAATDIDDTLGVEGWGSNSCDICETDCEVLACLGDEPDYDARWLNVCSDCLAKAIDIITRARARSLLDRSA